MKLKYLALLFFFLPTLTLAQHQVTLTWIAPTTGTPTGYNVYRYATVCPTPILISSATKVATTAATALTYVDTSVTAGSAYCYFVTALSASGETGTSNAMQVVIPLSVAANNMPPPVVNSPTVQ